MAVESSNSSSVFVARKFSGNIFKARSQQRLHSLSNPSSSKRGAAMQLISTASDRSPPSENAHSIAARTLPISSGRRRSLTTPGMTFALCCLSSSA
ncbi:hypothetical protein D3C85_471580 [compost metagenome]